MKSCKDIHPERIVDIRWGCQCRQKYSEYYAMCNGKQPLSDAQLLFTIHSCSRWWARQPKNQDKELFGIRCVCVFEAYSKASETWDAPWLAYITEDYAGVQYMSGRCENYRKALIWLAFHIVKLDEVWRT